MGVWGENNFENDNSLNTLGFLLQGIIKNIRDCFSQYTEASELIQNGEATIVANIEIIVVLCRHCKTYPDLDTEEIEKWFDTYLAAYDAFFPPTETMTLQTKRSIMIRRSIIVTTFYQLLRLVDELWNKD